MPSTIFDFIKIHVIFSLLFFRALAASDVLFNKPEHGQGFSDC